MRGASFIPLLGLNTIKTPYNQRPYINLYLAMHSASCDAVCDSAVFRMTAYDICANSAHDPVCKKLMDATTSMPTALKAYARIANDCSRHLCK